MRQMTDDWASEEMAVQNTLDDLQGELFELGYPDPLIDCEVKVTIEVTSRSQGVESRVAFSAVADFDSMVLDDISAETNIPASKGIDDIETATIMSQVGTLLKNLEL